MIEIRKYCCRYTRNIAKCINYNEMNKIIKIYPTIIIDVRSEQEYAEGHLNGAINIPLYRIKSETERIVEDKSKQIIVYCTSGVRSEKAQVILNSMGYMNVYNLISGFNQ